MKQSILKTIEGLKGKIKRNLLEIQNNQKEIRNILKQPASPERSAFLEEKYVLNKLLLSENNDFITIQLSLAKFMEKYSYSDLFEEESTPAPNVSAPNEKECFEMTINGSLPFDKFHPFFCNDDFFQKLIKHYEEVEEYESCSKLIKQRDSNPV